MIFLFTIFCTLFLNAEEMPIIAPPQITHEWEETHLGVIHGVINLPTAVEELTVGINDDYFDKAFIERIKKQVQKTPTGTYEEYWENGALKVRLPYKNGMPHGHIHGWYDNGLDAFKGYYDEGVKQGIHIAFFSLRHSEGYKFADKAKVITYNKKGELDGEQCNFHQGSGTDLKISIYYHNGVVNGPLEYWKKKQYMRSLGALYKDGILQKEPAPMASSFPCPFNEYVDETMREFEKEVYEEYGIKAWSSGGSMPSDIEKLKMGFTLYEKGTIKGARKLLVTLTQKLADMVNAHKEIRPYLREYPFGLNRAYVSLSYDNRDGSSKNDNSVTHVCQGRHGIAYSTDDPNGFAGFRKLHRESFEEALKIIQSEEETKK